LLVPVEKKGACSAKHAYLWEVAAEHSIGLDLCIGIFMMDRDNTPGIGSALSDCGLESIPEAHCFLKYRAERYDFTSHAESAVPHPQLTFIYEEKITPSQIGTYKTQLHKHWLEQWAHETKQSADLSELWSIRERCIAALS
jgi:hypothetical protein